ncbi:MAG TPA: hypothetical protein DDW22_07520 [Prevotellaceae bacterium]|nr:hypothetical protein [Prevotellaceae bacterium]
MRGDALVHVTLVVEVLHAVVLAGHGGLVLAAGEQSCLHFLQVEVLHGCDAPVRALVVLARPLVQGGSVPVQVEAHIALKVGFGGDVHITGGARVVGAGLDVYLHRAAAGLAEVALRVQVAAGAGVAQAVAVPVLGQYPHLCQVALLCLCALCLVAYLCQVGIGQAAVGQPHQPALVQYVLDVGSAGEVGHVLEHGLAQ